MSWAYRFMLAANSGICWGVWCEPPEGRACWHDEPGSRSIWDCVATILLPTTTPDWKYVVRVKRRTSRR